MRNNIRELRSEKGWTQKDLASHLEVTRRTVISIEQGRFNPSLPLAFAIAALFGRPIEEIFHGHEGDDQAVIGAHAD